MRPSKREHLLDTAERLFYEEGFHATGIDRVVAEASVVRMTLYNHFESKEALVTAVLERRHTRYVDRLRSAMAQAPNASLAALVDAHCDWIGSVGNHGCMLVKAMGEFEHHQPAVHAVASRCKRYLLELIREALATDGISDRDGAAEQVFLVLEGSNQLVPLIGAEATRDHCRAVIDATLHTNRETLQ